MLDAFDGGAAGTDVTKCHVIGRAHLDIEAGIFEAKDSHLLRNRDLGCANLAALLQRGEPGADRGQLERAAVIAVTTIEFDVRVQFREQLVSVNIEGQQLRIAVQA